VTDSIIDADDVFTVEWDGCDLVIETTVDYEVRTWPALGEQKIMDMVVIDRLCVTDMEHHGAFRFQFIAITEAW